jgi:hypothetical protein
MALVLADRVKETASAPGTGTVTLLGASTGFQSFAVVGNANTTYYTIADQSGTRWEVGIGTYTSSGTTLARTTVLSSSNAGSLVNFSSGTQDVFLTYPSAKAVMTDVSQTLSGKTLTLPTVTDYVETLFSANTGTAITINLANGTVQNLTLTGNATITTPTAVAGKSFLLMLRSGAGGYAVTWTTVKWPSGTAPTVTSTASRMDIYSFFSDGTNWYGTTVGANYTP